MPSSRTLDYTLASQRLHVFLKNFYFLEIFSTGLRFGTPVAYQGSGTRLLTRISLRRLLNSARLKGFGPATVTLLVLLYCLVQVISISSRMAFTPCGRNTWLRGLVQSRPLYHVMWGNIREALLQPTWEDIWTEPCSR